MVKDAAWSWVMPGSGSVPDGILPWPKLDYEVSGYSPFLMFFQQSSLCSSSPLFMMFFIPGFMKILHALKSREVFHRWRILVMKFEMLFSYTWKTPAMKSWWFLLIVEEFSRDHMNYSLISLWASCYKTWKHMKIQKHQKTTLVSDSDQDLNVLRGLQVYIMSYSQNLG